MPEEQRKALQHGWKQAVKGTIAAAG
jgi:hypothetical protein